MAEVTFSVPAACIGLGGITKDTSRATAKSVAEKAYNAAQYRNLTMHAQNNTFGHNSTIFQNSAAIPANNAIMSQAQNCLKALDLK